MIQEVIRENLRSKRPLGRPRLHWKDYIRKYILNIIGGDYGDWDCKEITKNTEEWKRICSVAI